jgi:hypothetical protein
MFGRHKDSFARAEIDDMELQGKSYKKMAIYHKGGQGS